MSSSETERSSGADSPAEQPGALPAVAPQLRALRRQASLTLEAAARAAGLSPAHLSRLETGQRQPSLPMLLALARVYGTTVAELLGETVVP
jgi:transcriptional regulator with XRE-family HTH domain